MNAIDDYTNEHRHHCVVELWESVFGCETANPHQQEEEDGVE